MKVGDLVQVKAVHQREFRAVAENRGYPVMPIVGIIIGIEANGWLQLDNRPMPAMPHYFEVISESR